MVVKKDPPGGDGTPETAATPTPTPSEATPNTTTNSTASTTTSASEAPADGATPLEVEIADTVAADAAPVIEKVVEDVEVRASRLIRNHVIAAAAAGAIPLMFVDAAALAAVQLRLLKELADAHGVEFRGDIGRSAIGTLLATVAPTALAGGVLGSMTVRVALRSMPVVAAVTQLATQPAFNAAFTYALGKVFHQHFASGGTFLTFEPEKVKTYFREKYNEARKRKGGAAAVVADDAAPVATPAAA